MKLLSDFGVYKYLRDFSDAPGLAEPHVQGHVTRAATRAEMYHVSYYVRVLVPQSFETREEALRWVEQVLGPAMEAAGALGGPSEG